MKDARRIRAREARAQKSGRDGMRPVSWYRRFVTQARTKSWECLVWLSEGSREVHASQPKLGESWLLLHHGVVVQAMNH